MTCAGVVDAAVSRELDNHVPDTSQEANHVDLTAATATSIMDLRNHFHNISLKYSKMHQSDLSAPCHIRGYARFLDL